MLKLIGLLLGAAGVVYFGGRPAVLGFPFPSLSGELAVRPTFRRIAAYFLGRCFGCLLLGFLTGWLGTIFHSLLLTRLLYANTVLLAIFMFLFIATDTSPEIRLARLTDPAKLNIAPMVMGFLSSITLISPLLLSILFGCLQQSRMGGVMLFANVFLGNALFSLPILLNMPWSKTIVYQNILRVLLFFCSLSVLILSIVNFSKY